MRADALSRRLDWKLPVIVALVLSGPLGAYVGDASGWLDGAWQVSAVLLGFVVALIVFLLQAAGGRSLRAEGTYRALISESMLAWPVALSLTFLGWVAIIERYADKTYAAPAWVTTWSLAFFLIQLAAFAVVFTRLLRLVAPAGVARVLQRGLRYGIRRSVEERLTRARADQLFTAACAQAGITAANPGGQAVTLRESGYIDDVDLRLPKALADFQLAEEVRSLAPSLGDRVAEHAAVARVDAPLTQLRLTLYREAIRLRSRPWAETDWMDLFQEAVDVGLRALTEGAARDLDSAIDVIVAGLEELPRAYRVFDVDYDKSTVLRPFQRTEEDRMLAELQRLTRDVFASGNGEAAVRMARMGYRMANIAIDGQVPLLLDQALDLWRYQTELARTIGSEAARKGAIDEVANLTFWRTRRLLIVLEDGTQPLTQRERAADILKQFSTFETHLLKIHIDAEDIDSFKALWSSAMEFEGQWDPENELARINGELAAATGERERRRLRDARERTEAILAKYNELQDVRDWGRLKLGAWLTWQYDHDRLTNETWGALRGYLVDPFDAGELLEHLEEMTSIDGPAVELDDWERGLHEVRTISVVYTPSASDMALLWTALLLLRRTTPANPPMLPVSPRISYIGAELGKQLVAIEASREKWSDFIPGDLAEKIEAVRESIQTADAAERQADAARVAAALLSDERIDEFRESSWTAFVETNPLRTRVQDADALEIESTPDAFGGVRFGQLVDKRLFIGPERAVAGPDLGGLGRAAAAREQVWLYEQLAERSIERERGDDAAAAALDAIARFRENGLNPDTILMPNNWSVRAAVTHHPAFEWSQRTRRARPTELGKLDGIPVLDIGPRDSNYLLIADLAKALRLHERVRPDDERPLRVEVRPIDATRAGQLIDAGRIQLAEGQTLAQAVADLHTWHVETFVDLDYCVSDVDRTAVVSIPLR